MDHESTTYSGVQNPSSSRGIIHSSDPPDDETAGARRQRQVRRRAHLESHSLRCMHEDEAQQMTEIC